ncbi:site-2 protease family protein [Gloeocapsa sp. PCC 73106]|uniref:site-2 protease family protein n=1 Tax=Gloeocapsa sp. PCC 73106 TaxID=102232 RepID=UPI0002ABFE6A|nr:site-2 protease family protein [Gloeocapsa sp. PCC 73106]ELR97332.1 putative membrane-associated Zn-dependent protease [Gloeocapsa sp. PCC 73106]
MFNQSETTLIAILIVALFILAWGYNRAKVYGKLGILAWLQSVILIAPWLVFFGLFALGIYLNLAGILLLLVSSIVIYIIIGKRLRALGQDTMIRQRAAERLKSLEIETATTEPASTPIAPLAIPEEDLQTIKSIFGVDTFFATETISYQEGAIFKGNLRGEPEMVYTRLWEKLTQQLGEKYRLFLVENPEAKPVVIILPSSNDPQPTNLAQKNLALVLLVATIATSLETSGLLLGFDLFSDLGRYREAMPITLGLWLILILHELGHRWIAQRYQIRLSIPFMLPSWQIGAFGAITRFESLIPNRKVLLDIALAGPAAGGLLSLAMIVIGLFLSHPGSSFTIPSQFFQGSVLVGTLARVIIGSGMNESVIDVHPLTFIGWLGLVITAINLLPVGQLDGGRILQAIYGRKVAKRATIITLIVLAIVAVVNPTNPLPLYWGVLILFLQRDLERPSLNELIEVDDARAAWGLLALFLAFATLIPLSPSLAGRLGIGI